MKIKELREELEKKEDMIRQLKSLSKNEQIQLKKKQIDEELNKYK